MKHKGYGLATFLYVFFCVLACVRARARMCV